MTNSPPPYRPLRGAEPPHFADRADEDDLSSAGIAAGSARAYAAGPADPRFHRLIYGFTAMGKTAMLRAVGRQAGALGWAVAHHRCRPKEAVFEVLPAGAFSALQRRWPAQAGSRLGPMAQHPSATGATAPPRGARPLALIAGVRSWARAYQLMKVAGHFCLTVGGGLLVALDDADRLPAGEFEALGHLARALSSECLPVAFLLSGPPHLARQCARAAYFSDSLWPTRLGELEQAEAREALVVPAAERGVEIDQDAVELICGAAGGSPLDLQRLAFTAWSVASRPGVVTRADAEAALALTCAPAAREAS